MTLLASIIKSIPILDRWAENVSAHYWAWKHKRDVNSYYDAKERAQAGDTRDLQKEMGKHL